MPVLRGLRSVSGRPMIPKPTDLPPPRDMTDAQAVAEAIRILRNSGGPEYGAGYSWELAERLALVGLAPTRL